MLADEPARLRQREDTYWWHVARRHLLRTLLRDDRAAGGGVGDVLDVGCGTGRNLELLAELGRARGVEPAGPLLDACRERGLDVVEGVAEAIPFPDQSFNLVTALEVLEHLDDDAAGLREMVRVLRPGGRLLVTVPAYRFLWSSHDEALGHRRRYLAGEVSRLLAAGGLQVLRCTYAVAVPLPGFALVRLVQRFLPPSGGPRSSYVELPAPVDRLLVAALQLEAAALRHVDLPLGSSIVALARRG